MIIEKLNFDLEKFKQFVTGKFGQTSAETLGWLSIILLHAATVPSFLAVMSGLTDRAPSIDLVLLIWSALTLLFIKSAVQKDMLNLITIGLGFIIQASMLALIYFKQHFGKTPIDFQVDRCYTIESIHAQAAEEQMYAIAMNNFAKRINSEVNSSTEINFDNDKKTTKTRISYTVKNTTIREHLNREVGQFTMAGRNYTFVRLKMPKAVFDQLIAEAKAQKAQ